MEELKKQKYNKFYMDIAERVSQMSHAVRLKVGSVLVKNGNIISFGWNGTPSGRDNNCEDIVWDPGAGGWLDPEEFDAKYPFEMWHEKAGRNVRYGLKTKQEVLHAEQNCLMKIARSTESSENSTLFVTVAPCLDCSKLIYQSGINTVYYRQAYRETTGIEFLTDSGVKVEQYTSEQ